MDEVSKIGKISKQWSGLLREAFTDTDNFGIKFPMDLDVRMKAVMIAACFLIVSATSSLLTLTSPACQQRKFTFPFFLLGFRIKCCQNIGYYRWEPHVTQLLWEMYVSSPAVWDFMSLPLNVPPHYNTTCCGKCDPRPAQSPQMQSSSTELLPDVAQVTHLLKMLNSKRVTLKVNSAETF